MATVVRWTGSDSGCFQGLGPFLWPTGLHHDLGGQAGAPNGRCARLRVGRAPAMFVDAGIEDAEIVAAVTGTDEENLVICQIAKISNSGKKTIARVNNPKNISMFKALGSGLRRE